MSAPAMNAVLPTGGSAAPNAITPLSLTVNPVKTSPPPPVVPKPQPNHNAALSLVQENKIKTPEKPKETPAEPTKPTSNGVDTSPVSKAEEPAAASASSGDLPAASSADAAPAEVPKAAAEPKPEPAVAPAAAPPAPVEVATPPASAEPAAPAPASGGPAVPVSSKPDPVENEATPSPPTQEKTPESVAVEEAPKPKTVKAQGAKRRREPAAAEARAATEGSTPEKKPRRTRAPVSPYQSPLPEITTVIKTSLREKTVNAPKATDEKLIVFYKNEFLAVRNAEGSFYLCQTTQNVYRTSHKIKIRWLSRDEKESTSDGGIYAADFYDATDFECILTSVSLQKQGKNKYKMPAVELDRVENILKRALDVEKGVSVKPDVTEEHPDGLDVSLFKDESQLQKSRKRAEKRKRSPVVKKDSPKKVVVKTKKVKPAVATVVAAPSTPSTSKAKPPARKPPAKRQAPPPIIPRNATRVRVISCGPERKKDENSPRAKSNKKAAKNKKPYVLKSPPASKKVKVAEKPAAPAKAVKKAEKGKSKPPAPVVPTAGSSSAGRRTADKTKKPAPALSEKRSTRKKTRK